MDKNQLNSLMLAINSKILEEATVMGNSISSQIAIKNLSNIGYISDAESDICEEVSINIKLLSNGENYCLKIDNEFLNELNLKLNSDTIIKLYCNTDASEEKVITTLTMDDYGTIFRVNNDEENKILNLYIKNKRYEVNYNDNSSVNTIIVTEYVNKYLGIDNTAEYTPTTDYNPATKKYVDENGLTPTAKTLLATLLQNIPYSTDQSANVTAFLQELGVNTEQS